MSEPWIAIKTAGSRGRTEYLRKPAEVLHSPVYLVDIDLLRQGERFPSRQPLPPADCYVHVSRAARRPKGEVWPIRLRDRLPAIPIPLAGKDPDATLDLGEALRQTYDRGGYDVRMRYDRAPDPPLPADEQEWAAGVVKGTGG